jgi:hypothetical protein
VSVPRALLDFLALLLWVVAIAVCLLLLAVGATVAWAHRRLTRAR